MNARDRTLLASLVLISLFGCGDKKTEHKDVEARVAANKARAAEWSFIAKTKNISPSESIKLIRIPDDSGIDLLDTQCIVYTNSELKTSNIACLQDYSYETDQAVR